MITRRHGNATSLASRVRSTTAPWNKRWVVSLRVALALLRVIRLSGALPRRNSCAKQVAHPSDAARNDRPQAPNAGGDARAMISSDLIPAALLAQATRMGSETEQDYYTQAKGQCITHKCQRFSLEGCPQACLISKVFFLEGCTFVRPLMYTMFRHAYEPSASATILGVYCSGR